MTERSRRILTVLTNQLTHSIARVVVFEAVAMAEAVDEDEATKAASPVRKIARTSRNAYQTRNISIVKIITSTLTIVVLAILETPTAYFLTLNVTSYRPKTTRRKLSRLEVIRTARIEARNDLTAERTLYALTTTRMMTMTSIPLMMMTTISLKNAPLSV